MGVGRDREQSQEMAGKWGNNREWRCLVITIKTIKSSKWTTLLFPQKDLIKFFCLCMCVYVCVRVRVCVF
jgi:hypothetical protein